MGQEEQRQEREANSTAQEQRKQKKLTVEAVYGESAGVFRIPDPKNSQRKVLATLNLTPGRSFYGERLVKYVYGGRPAEFRLWDPFRSKLSAAVLRGLRSFPLENRSTCLYLGASTGTTVSHVSDIVGSEGRVFATEVAPRVARELLESVVKFRSNVVPIIADARRPESYPSIYGKVSSVYCDIAQQNQTEIAIANCSRYLRPEGILILVVKASSIDALTPKAKVFREQTNILERSEFEVNELLDLEPFDRNHALILARPRRR